METFHAASWQEVTPKGAYAYDSLGQWKTITEKLFDIVEPQLGSLKNIDNSLYNAEMVHLAKAGACWRWPGLGRMCRTEDYSVYKPKQGDALRPYLTKIGKDYLKGLEAQSDEELSAMADEARVVLNKGKGWPMWSPGSDTASAMYLAKVTNDSEDLTDMIDRLNTVVPVWMIPVITGYQRVQASKSDEPWNTDVGGIITRSGVFRGPKLRDVKAVSFVVNFQFTQLAWIMKYTLRKISVRHNGSIDQAVIFRQKYKYCIAADLKKYDNTVSYETMSLYHEVVLAPVIWYLVKRRIISARHARLMLSLDNAMLTMSILAPPRMREEAAALISSAGGIKSGERLTSQKGTDINNARIQAKADRLGLVIEWCNFSDDTMIFSNDSRLAELWSENGEMFEFVEELDVDTSYLMRRVPQGYNYYARLLSSSINKEWSAEPRSVLAAAAAMAIRRELLRGHPLVSKFIPTLRSLGGRLERAAAIANDVEAEVLILAAARESLAAGQDRGRSGISLPEDTAVRLGLGSDLAEAIEAATDRSEMKHAEFMSQMDDIPMTLAYGELRNRSYTLGYAGRVELPEEAASAA